MMTVTIPEQYQPSMRHGYDFLGVTESGHEFRVSVDDEQRKGAWGHYPIDAISIFTKGGMRQLTTPVDLPRTETGFVDVKNPITVMIVSRLWEQRLEELINEEAENQRLREAVASSSPF